MSASKIEWTQATWNPLTGCTKYSPGCDNCYAEKMAYRLQAMGQANYKNGFKLTIHKDLLLQPYKWKKPRLIFVNSMSDLFHEGVPESFIADAFSVMNDTPRHTYQILTKRSKRLAKIAHKLPWPKNIWMGVSVEGDEYSPRINHLASTDAKTQFVSYEPLLGPISDFETEALNWVIVGGESGPGARPIQKEWVIDIKSKCLEKGIPFFFKQWGGTNKKKTGRLLDGRTWDQMPEVYTAPTQPHQAL